MIYLYIDIFKLNYVSKSANAIFYTTVQETKMSNLLLHFFLHVFFMFKKVCQRFPDGSASKFSIGPKTNLPLDGVSEHSQRIIEDII